MSSWQTCMLTLLPSMPNFICGRLSWLLLNSCTFLSLLCFPEADLDTSIGVITSLQEESACHSTEIKVTRCRIPAAHCPLWLPSGWPPCPPTDGIGGAAVQRQTEVEVPYLLSTVFLLWSCPPFWSFSKIYCSCSVHCGHVWQNLLYPL